MEVLIFMLVVVWTFGVAKYFVDTIHYRWAVSIWATKNNWFTRWCEKSGGRWMPLDGKHFFMALQIWPSLWLNMYLLGILDLYNIVWFWVIAYQIFLWPYHYFGVQKNSVFREDPIRGWFGHVSRIVESVWSNVKQKAKKISF